MDITDELIEELAALSKLKFEDEAKAQIREEFARMLGFVDVLREVDTEGVAPLMHMTETTHPGGADTTATGIHREEMLKRAPEAQSPYFSVPKVVDK